MALYNVLGDKPIKDRVGSLKNEMSTYIKSPEYKKRLIGQGVKNPDKVISQRLSKLGQVNVTEGPQASLMYMFTNPGQKEKIPSLSLSSDDSDYTAMHELSHVTNYGDTFFDPNVNKYAKSNFGDANTASGKGMSLNEMLYMTDRTNLPGQIKSGIRERAESNKRVGAFANPTDNMPGESHSFDPSELKSDLDAVRLLFKKNGLVKEFGENITEDTINKALKNPKIANEEHFIRMMKNFNKKNLIDVNNNIAMNGLAKATMS
jgi:hypothetical protein